MGLFETDNDDIEIEVEVDLEDQLAEEGWDDTSLEDEAEAALAEEEALLQSDPTLLQDLEELIAGLEHNEQSAVPALIEPELPEALAATEEELAEEAPTQEPEEQAEQDPEATIATAHCATSLLTNAASLDSTKEEVSGLFRHLQQNLLLDGGPAPSLESDYTPTTSDPHEVEELFKDLQKNRLLDSRYDVKDDLQTTANWNINNAAESPNKGRTTNASGSIELSTPAGAPPKLKLRIC